MNLSEPRVLREFLAKHGLTARKGLGQHFLASPSAVATIVARVSDCAGILEIGPGPGILTAPLSEQAEKLIALEVDDRMIAALPESAPKADVRKIDALEADLASILEELPEPRAVVSNLPYYITGPLITRIAETKRLWSKAILMMQKEVGVRVLAPAGSSDRGSLSVYLQSQFTVRRVAVVPAGAFLPPPNVDSVVLEFTPNPPLVPGDQEAGFHKMIRTAFTQPRKTLANNLLDYGRAKITEALAKSLLRPDVRPHMLTLDEWVRLHQTLTLR